MGAPLDGIRVLDFSRVLSGPYATMFLADMGADVVKVEHPDHVDDTRGFGPPFCAGVSTYYLSINRGKRAVSLDLKSEDGRAKALALADVADVVVENFRPGVAGRLGIGYDDLSARNPRLVYCSISGFGQAAGPKPGYDVVIQGLSGIPHLTGAPDTPPFKVGTSVADMVAGINAAQGILAALYRRERTGKGGYIDVSLLDSHRSMLSFQASSWLNAGVEPKRIGNDHPSIHPYSAFRAKDGYFNIAVGNDALWNKLCALLTEIGREEGERLAADDRFTKNHDRVAHREELSGIICPMFESRTVDEWVDALTGAGIPAGRIATVPEALEGVEFAEHEHPEGGPPVRTLPLPFKIDGETCCTKRRAPRIGEHNIEVMADWLPDRNHDAR